MASNNCQSFFFPLYSTQCIHTEIEIEVKGVNEFQHPKNIYSKEIFTRAVNLLRLAENLVIILIDICDKLICEN